MEAPRYKCVPPAVDIPQRFIVLPEVSPSIFSLYLKLLKTAQVRPIGIAAVLRNITFTKV